MVFASTDQINNGVTKESADGIVPLERTASTRAGNMVNDTEAILVRRIVGALVAGGMPPSSIGVICPFNAQVSLSGIRVLTTHCCKQVPHH
mgnify:CR=1 FL=1